MEKEILICKVCGGEVTECNVCGRDFGKSDEVLCTTTLRHVCNSCANIMPAYTVLICKGCDEEISECTECGGEITSSTEEVVCISGKHVCEGCIKNRTTTLQARAK